MTRGPLRVALVVAGSAGTVLAALAAGAAGQPEPDGGGGNLGRLRSMSLEGRRRLSLELRRFESLPTVEQRAIRALHAQIEAEPPEVRERYREVARRYYNWVQSLPASEREALRSGSAKERLERVSAQLREADAAARGPELDVALARGSALNPLSFLDQVQAIRIWLALGPAEREELDRAAPAERLRRLERLGAERGVPDDRPDLRRRADEMFREWAGGRGGPGGPGGLRKFDASKVQEKAETLRRLAEARFLARMPAAPVEPAELARLADALPSWIRQSLDALPPAGARERLRLIYRALWPEGTMPADVRPWRGPAGSAEDRPEPRGPGGPPPGGVRPPGPPPPPTPPGTPGAPF